MKTRIFNATYTLDASDYTDSASIMREKMDKEIMGEIENVIEWNRTYKTLTHAGWATVKVPYRGASNSVEVAHWVEDNIVGDYKKKGSTWLFQNEEEAMLFKLRWGGNGKEYI